MPVQPGEGLRLFPFRAVRYNPAAVSDLDAVTAPPYDVIDEDEHHRLEAADPRNVVRLILPRDPSQPDLRVDPSGRQAELPTKYLAAAATFDRWLADGTLVADERPALYVYQQSRGGVVLQCGLFGAVAIEPFEARVILPHENVRPGPVEDRLALMRAMDGNPEPILLLYDGGGAATEISGRAVCGPSLAAFQGADAITHQLWAITDPDELAAITDDLRHRQAMIADGHHRYTTYGYLRDELRAAGRGAGPWDQGLALLADDSVATPEIHAIHRAIPGFPLMTAVNRIAGAFRVKRLARGVGVPAALAELATRASHAYLLTDGDEFVIVSDPDPVRLAAVQPPERTSAWWALDASVANVFVLEHLCGVSDAAGEVEAEHDPHAAVRIAEQTNGFALLLNPAPLRGIMAVADAGEAMPRKSTLFLPKPRSGVVMRSFRFEL